MVPSAEKCSQWIGNIGEFWFHVRKDFQMIPAVQRWNGLPWKDPVAGDASQEEGMKLRWSNALHDLSMPL